MSAQPPLITPSPTGSATPSEHARSTSKGKVDDKHLDERNSDNLDSPTSPPLAAGGNQRMEGALGDAVLRFLRIRKGPKGPVHDLDAVCTDFKLRGLYNGRLTKERLPRNPAFGTLTT